jgi:hypothetical protein
MLGAVDRQHQQVPYVRRCATLFTRHLQNLGLGVQKSIGSERPARVTAIDQPACNIMDGGHNDAAHG